MFARAPTPIPCAANQPCRTSRANMAGVSLTREIDYEGSRMIFTGVGPDGVTKNVIIWKRRV